MTHPLSLLYFIIVSYRISTIATAKSTRRSCHGWFGKRRTWCSTNTRTDTGQYDHQWCVSFACLTLTLTQSFTNTLSNASHALANTLSPTHLSLIHSLTHSHPFTRPITLFPTYPTYLTTHPSFIGIGVFRWDDHGQYYAGDWKDGKQNGNGVMRFPNGGIYEGKQTLTHFTVMCYDMTSLVSSRLVSHTILFFIHSLTHSITFYSHFLMVVFESI